MLFQSVLFDEVDTMTMPEDCPIPGFFRDLNLDQIVDAVVARKGSYHLKPFFFSPLASLDSVVYRQEVFADLERQDVYDLVVSFAEEKLVEGFRYRQRDLEEDDLGFSHNHRERWFLNATQQYCDAVLSLASHLAEAEIRSRALCGLRDYLAGYVGSESFVALHTEASRLESELNAVHYCLSIKGNRITVGRYDDEVDYGGQVAATFERFQQGAVADYLPAFRDWKTYAAAGILDLVAKVYPELFSALDTFCVRYRTYLDHTIGIFDRQIQFYLSYLSFIRPLRDVGLVFSRPLMSSVQKGEQVLDTFDLALAAQLVRQDKPVVCNNVTLTGPERILVISGPNNGGKTTLARTVGQLHYLARLGCPVPGHDVRLFLCDQIFTHFEREENLTTLVGKLQDELNRLKADFDRATSNSLIILNEVFNSTTAYDALFLSKQVLKKVAALGALGVCVTFLDELASLNETTVSMVGTVVPDDPATRTHKLIRKPADGRAYARAIADKYGLSFALLTEEITR